MEVNSFQILLIDVTFIINMFKMWYFILLMKKKNRIYSGPAAKGL